MISSFDIGCLYSRRSAYRAQLGKPQSGFSRDCTMSLMRSVDRAIINAMLLNGAVWC